MPIITRLNRELGVRTPIVSAPMAGVSGGVLAAQVSNAGGFGFVAAGYLTDQQVLAQLDKANGERVGVGFITWRVQEDRSAFDAVLDRKPPAIFLSFGDAAGLVEPVRKAGSTLFMQVQSLAGAWEATALGADVIVVQGSEAGGHGAQRALGPLLDEIRAADLGPIILAAGGIANGRSMAAALIRGADGVLCGTAFFAAQESLAHEAAKSRAICADGDKTERSDLFDAARQIAWPAGWTLRTAQNDFARKWHDAASFASASAEDRESFAQAVATGNFDIAPVIVGEGVGLLNSVETAGEILKQIEREAEDVLRRAPALLLEDQDND